MQQSGAHFSLRGLLCSGQSGGQSCIRQRPEQEISNTVTEMRLPMQEAPLLSGGVARGNDTEEGIGAPRAPEPGTPQVGGPVAPWWFVCIHVNHCGCRPIGFEAPD